ncbi:MAG: DUF302 domain-containing protein [Actinomycetota bacterium]|nr:DUF302 domain-containing protein [Actinomycetota bacterium]
MEYAYKRVGTMNFTKTIEAVERSARDHGFDVLHYHDITAALAAKGFPIRPLAIFEIAPAGVELEVPVSLLMPCRVNVYEQDSEVVIAALRPTLFSAVYPEHGLDEIALEFEKAVVAVVDGAVG